jgi:hypothetical protein
VRTERDAGVPEGALGLRGYVGLIMLATMCALFGTLPIALGLTKS